MFESVSSEKIKVMFNKLREKRRQKKNILYKRIYITWLHAYAKHGAWIKCDGGSDENGILNYIDPNKNYNYRIESLEDISEYQENIEKNDNNSQFKSFHQLPDVTFFKKRGKYHSFGYKILRTYD